MGPKARTAALEERAAAVLAEDVSHRVADLADRAAGAERLLDRREEVGVAASGLAQLLELGVHGLLIAVCLPLSEAIELSLLGLRVDLEDVDVVDLVGDVLVD